MIFKLHQTIRPIEDLNCLDYYLECPLSNNPYRVALICRESVVAMGFSDVTSEKALLSLEAEPCHGHVPVVYDPETNLFTISGEEFQGTETVAELLREHIPNFSTKIQKIYIKITPSK